MTKKLRIVLAQLNLLVGDITGNLQKHKIAIEKARSELAADVIVFPELSLTGYPAEDLLLRPAFLKEAQEAAEELQNDTRDIYCVYGYPHQTSEGLHNTCSLIYNGLTLGRYAKQILPNYGVFDEYRYFVPGNSSCVVPIKGILVGLLICEDLWYSKPIKQAANLGARLILSPNASPFEVDKYEKRVAAIGLGAKTHQLPIVYVNQIGGQDELVFDGGSMIVNSNGEVADIAPFFQEALHVVDIEFSDHETKVPTRSFALIPPLEKIYQSLLLGLKDYVAKNYFKSVLIGVSGGIDSALTLAIAVDALGKENVYAVYMPSRYSADISEQDALTIAKNFGIHCEVISIDALYQHFLDTLAPQFKNQKVNITEENIQARCRAIILMALSNKFGHLVLTTGNRSEMAVGYATLYGDMAGGFAVLKDVPKTMVYELAKHRNRDQTMIPQRSLERAPTAELALDQKDEDTLPPYPLLDKILELYLNQQLSIQDIVALGFDRAMVTKIVKMINKNEYKRRQSAIGIRINHKAFGKDRRYPITSEYKG